MPINQTPFYHEHTRKLLTVFGTLFNNIKVVRDNGKEITVPLQYGSKEKWYIRKAQNPDLLRPESIILPRMGFVNKTLGYDAVRKLNSLTRLTTKDDTSNTSIRTVFQPVPYNINVEMYVWAKTMTDGLQILEQILPFFRPSFTVTMTEMAEPIITRDVLITLNDVSHDDNAEGLLADTRMLEWMFSFDIEANFYGPITDTSIIKTVYIHTHIMDGEEVLRLTGTPDPTDADAEDAWTFNEVWEEFPALS